MKRIAALALMVGLFTIALTACASDPEPTATPRPNATPNPTVNLQPTTVPVVGSQSSPIIPAGAEIDRKTAMLLGIDLHRQLWATRPSSNYKFGFEWTTGEFAYQRANVEVRILKNEIDAVRWADNAVKTDGTEPAGFIVPDEPDQNDYYSIDGLFDVIQEAIDSNPGSVTLGFDSVFGFPTNVDIRFLPGDEHPDVSFFAAQLVPIPGPPE